MALRMRDIRYGLISAALLLTASVQAWAQDTDGLDRLRNLLPVDSALAFGDRADEGDVLILSDVVVDLIWRTSRIQAGRLSLDAGSGSGDLTVTLDDVVLRNAHGSLAADRLALDANAIAVLQHWSLVEAPDESVDDDERQPDEEPVVDIPPGGLSAENLTIHAASQPHAQGWFIGDLELTGLTPTGVDKLEMDNLVIYAMGRIQAGTLTLRGLDAGWMSGLSGLQDIVAGLLPPGGLALAITDFLILDPSGRSYVAADQLSASFEGRPAPMATDATDEDAEALSVGVLELDLTVDGFVLPLDTLQPLLMTGEWEAVLPDTLSGNLRFAGTVDGPAQELTIETGLIDLADIAYVEGGLALTNVSFAPDAPQMPLAMMNLPGSIPMFSVAGAHLEAEDLGVIGVLEAGGVALPSASIDRLASRLADRLPMLAGRLDGVLAWLRRFESGERATVRLAPETPAPAVELLSMMLINPDGVVERLGLTD
ncbi:MAG: hypothetical protein AAF414_03390 [Pseudomonadota bacterium]